MEVLKHFTKAQRNNKNNHQDGKYKISAQKSEVSLYTNNELTEKEITKILSSKNLLSKESEKCLQQKL